MDKDLISVNIIARNAERTVARTLDSVFTQQDVRMEIVFINDASTDSTGAIAEEYKAKAKIPFTIIANQTNLGITKSRNKALEASTGSYIAVIDSDDVWTSPTKLKRQLAFLGQNRGHIVIGTQMRLVTADGKGLSQTTYPHTDTEIRNSMLVFNQFCHSSILMRNLGQRYDETLYIWEDYDLLLGLGLQGSLANLDEVMVDYLYVPRKYPFLKRFRLLSAEFRIIRRYKKKYPNYALGYLKRVVKLALVLLHLK